MPSVLLDRDLDNKYYRRETYDLCPDCLDSFLKWLSNEDKEKCNMTPNEYQREAMRTDAGTDYPTMEPIVNAALGIAGEGGEVADIIKKHIFQGHELDREHVAKELGDVLWYIALGAHSIGYSLEQIMEMNVEKLRNRYPDGFESDRSIHRVEGDI